MHKSTRTIIAISVLAAASVSGAAAASLTKEQVIARGTVICKAAEHRVEMTPGPQSQNPFAANAPKGDKQRAIRFIAVYASSLDRVRIGIGRLVPLSPPSGRPLLSAFVADLKPTVAAFRAGHAAALAHHYTLAMNDAERGFTLFAHASHKTKKYGFPKGVCQSGSN